MSSWKMCSVSGHEGGFATYRTMLRSKNCSLCEAIPGLMSTTRIQHRRTGYSDTTLDDPAAYYGHSTSRVSHSLLAFNMHRQDASTPFQQSYPILLALEYSCLLSIDRTQSYLVDLGPVQNSYVIWWHPTVSSTSLLQPLHLCHPLVAAVSKTSCVALSCGQCPTRLALIGRPSLRFYVHDLHGRLSRRRRVRALSLYASPLGVATLHPRILDR